MQAHAPRTRFPERLLVLGPEASLFRAASPVGPSAPTLEAIAAQKRGLALPNVAEARHVDAVGSIANGIAVGRSVHAAVGAAPHDVVHQVLADLATGIAEPASGIEQDPRLVDREITQKVNARLTLDH